MDPIERAREVDQWLESALSQYSEAEPRIGLESRVLANLQAERSRVASRRRWWWAAGAGAATAALAVAVWLGHGDRARTAARVGTGAIRQDEAGGRPITHPLPEPPVQQVTRKALRRPPTQRTPHAPEVGDVARLEQFPARTPLSDQEKLLARYVQEFPQRAALIARAQTQLRKRDEFEMAAPWPKNTDSNGSEQPE